MLSLRYQNYIKSASKINVVLLLKHVITLITIIFTNEKCPIFIKNIVGALTFPMKVYIRNASVPISTAYAIVSCIWTISSVFNVIINMGYMFFFR